MRRRDVLRRGLGLGLPLLLPGGAVRGLSVSGIRGLAEESFATFTYLEPAVHHEQARHLWAMFGPYMIDDSLVPLAVDVACLASITAYDAGAHDTGHAWALRAGRLAARSHSPELQARAAGMASIHKSTSHGPAPDRREALRLVTQAREQAPAGVMSVWANPFAAIEHAAAGHRTGCVKALNNAERNLSRGHGHGFFSDQGYLRSFASPARVAGTTGRCLALLGDAVTGLRELGSALSLPATATSWASTGCAPFATSSRRSGTASGVSRTSTSASCWPKTAFSRRALGPWHVRDARCRAGRQTAVR